MKKLVPIWVCLLLVISCQAVIITVDDDGPAHYSNIQDAIDSANDGDTIIVQPGFYDENINFLGKNITLTSTNPVNPNIVATTVIQSDVVLRGTEDPNCTLTGFKINAQIIGFDSSIDTNGENHTHATIVNCILQGNGTCGGNVIGACDGIISNCLITDNYTICYHVYPVISACHGLIKNCTIANNNSGIYIADHSSAVIQNCIIYHNWEQRPQINLGNSATLNISYSDLQGGIGEIYIGDSNCIVNWDPGNINTDPCFVRVGYWDEELEQIIEGDYHLQSAAGRWDPNINDWVTDVNTSICIDAGNPGCPLDSEVKEGNNIRINMGAYGGTPTASKPPLNWQSIADLTNDWKVDFDDLKAFADYWLDSGKCIPCDLSRSELVDFVDFAILANNWLWQK